MFFDFFNRHVDVIHDTCQEDATPLPLEHAIGQRDIPYRNDLILMHRHIRIIKIDALLRIIKTQEQHPMMPEPTPKMLIAALPTITVANKDDDGLLLKQMVF